MKRPLGVTIFAALFLLIGIGMISEVFSRPLLRVGDLAAIAALLLSGIGLFLRWRWAYWLTLVLLGMRIGLDVLGLGNFLLTKFSAQREQLVVLCVLILGPILKGWMLWYFCRPSVRAYGLRST